MGPQHPLYSSPNEHALLLRNRSNSLRKEKRAAEAKLLRELPVYSSFHLGRGNSARGSLQLGPPRSHGCNYRKGQPAIQKQEPTPILPNTREQCLCNALRATSTKEALQLRRKKAEHGEQWGSTSRVGISGDAEEKGKLSGAGPEWEHWKDLRQYEILRTVHSPTQAKEVLGQAWGLCQVLWVVSGAL